MLQLGVRREDKPREQRAPLSPAHVSALLQALSTLRVLVQRSSLRVYPDEAYTRAGATLVDDETELASCGVILGVKELPLSALAAYRPGTTIVCFAHVIKAQPAGMPLLSRLIDLKLRLIDYEAITEGGVRGGPRLIAFGRFAGIAGAIDILRGLGERCLALGFATPFLGVACTWQYATLAAALDAVRACGSAIARDGLHPALCPFLFVITGGAGRAASGAREVWELLPLKWVTARELPSIFTQSASARIACGQSQQHLHVLYACACDIKDTVRLRRRPPSPPLPAGGGNDAGGGGALPSSPSVLHNPALVIDVLDGVAIATKKSEADGDEEVNAPLLSGGEQDDDTFEDVDREHYKAHPDAYEAVFHKRIAPYASVILHAAYWGPGYPRLLTCAQVRALSKVGCLRCLAISDVSCDVGGAIEFCLPTTIANPFFIFDPLKGEGILNDITALPGVDGGLMGRGILYHAVDHLPSECPRDASDYFGECLLAILPALLAFTGSTPHDASTPSRCGADATDAHLPVHLRGAIICESGALTPNFAYIAALRAANARAEASRGMGGGDTLPPRAASPLQLLGLQRSETFITLELTGHVFDTGLLNRALDAIEESSGSARILECHVGRGRQHDTELRLQVFAPPHKVAASQGGGGGALLSVLAQLQAMASAAGVRLRVCGADSHLLRGAPSEELPLATSFSSDGVSLLPLASAPNSPRSQPLHVVTGTLAPSPRVQHRALLLGSGFVSGPCLELLLRRGSTHVTIATAVLPEALALARGRPTVSVVPLDVMGDATRLRELVEAHDVVISLVPAHLHVHVARAAIDARTDMVTASYVSPEFAALHDEAASAGVTLLGECGLDPGIDHMTVCRLVHAVQARGGIVTSFLSFCGGLPAPESATNPLGYKWSWSPRGALAAMGNGAHYLRNGAHVTVAPGGLLAAATRTFLSALPAFALELLPNRDSISYAVKYGIEGPQLLSIQRGTLRYQGFSARLALLAGVGLLSQEATPLPALLDSAASLPSSHVALGDLLSGLLGSTSRMPLPALASALLERAGSGSCSLTCSDAEEFLLWLGGLCATVPLVTAPLPPRHFFPLDTLTALLAQHKDMAYGACERDMAAMQHELRVTLPSGEEEVHTSTLLQFGDAHGTAMARTVGFAAAAAACVLLDADGGSLPRGVCTPVTPVWYSPILAALEREGIAPIESVRIK